MAEAILRSKEIEGVTVRSAGVSAFDGLPISSNAQDAYRRGGHAIYTGFQRGHSGGAWSGRILS